MLLLEKCWAKLYGSYEAIEAGLPYRGIMDLTGAPGECFGFEKEAAKLESGEFFDMICRFDQAGYIMAAGTPGLDDKTKEGKVETGRGGLVPSHAYTILAAKKYKDNLEKALIAYAKAAEGDPDDVAVLAAMCDCHSGLGKEEYRHREKAELYARAYNAASRCVELQPADKSRVL